MQIEGNQSRRKENLASIQAPILFYNPSNPELPDSLRGDRARCDVTSGVVAEVGACCDRDLPGFWRAHDTDRAALYKDVGWGNLDNRDNDDSESRQEC